jgi:hypothetical protein
MRCILVVVSGALAVLSWGCGSDVEPSPSGASAAASGSGAGGGGGIGAGSGGGISASSGGGGSGGEAGDASGSGGAVVEYRAVNLFTGAPRFELTKKDVDRDLCFHLRILMAAGQTATFEQPGPPFDELLVSNDASECGDAGGPPPAPPSTTSVPASDADGTIELSEPPCVVTAAFTLAFDADPSAPWVPATEAFEVAALPVENGCP